MKNLNHLAVIMDGNTRWASNRNLPSKAGHKEGVKKARLAVEYALEKKIDYLTLFAFSTENWLREEGEVRDLISLFFDALEEQTPELREEKVKLNFIGDISRFNKKLIKQIETSKKLTEEYEPKLNLIIAASYGGKWDIINAIKKFHADKNNKELNENSLENYLETKSFPDPDLIIRSGGLFPSSACSAAIAPILSTSMSDFLLSMTPVFEIIQSSLLLINFAVSFDSSI